MNTVSCVDRLDEVQPVLHPQQQRFVGVGRWQPEHAHDDDAAVRDVVAVDVEPDLQVELAAIRELLARTGAE
jgi:hypothetical protein